MLTTLLNIHIDNKRRRTSNEPLLGGIEAESFFNFLLLKNHNSPVTKFTVIILITTMFYELSPKYQ